MRLAVLADVHGNLPALEAVLVDVQQRDIDGFDWDEAASTTA